MPPNYALARDHLQQAAIALDGSDSRTRQLRYIIERTIVLMEETHHQQAAANTSNVLEIAAFRGRCGAD